MDEVEISLREDVYRKLDAERREGESVSDVLERLLVTHQDEHPLRQLQGLLDDDEAEQVRERVEAFRASVDEQMDRYR